MRAVLYLVLLSRLWGGLLRFEVEVEVEVEDEDAGLAEEGGGMLDDGSRVFVSAPGVRASLGRILALGSCTAALFACC